MPFWKTGKHDQRGEPAAKRISTPAGQRLSQVILNGDQRKANRASMRKNGVAVGITDASSQSSEKQSSNFGGYSWSVWSDGEKFAIFRDNKQITKRGGWRKILLIVAILICAIIALAVGLAVGLKKKGSNDSSPQSAVAEEPSPVAHTTSPNVMSTPTGTLAPPSSTPTSFPVGSYSMVTFLDTIQTNCTANPATWTCHPNTIFNEDPIEAVAAFNWIISTSSGGKLQISSTEDNPFGIAFKNVELELVDEGKDAERYWFQTRKTKTVKPEKSITEDDAETECDFKGTSLQGYLYTKMARSYPDTEKGEPEGDADFPVWPYAVRVEQSVGGGPGVPSCRKVSGGDEITEGLETQDPSTLCSCLYKNWRTPSLSLSLSS